MEKFILGAEKILLDDFQIQVNLKPTSDLIKSYIATGRCYLHTEATDLAISEFINEMTPLLYDEFENMQNVPIEIRNQFEL
jgi:hypothetical protein